MAFVLSPLLCFGLLEAGLRLAGYGYPTSFFLPFEVNGKAVSVQNNQFGWRFFGPDLARAPLSIVLPKTKPPETCRIFVFGESAAFGDPQPAFGLPRMLETLLRERYPGVQFEVVNVAMTAINSHVILPIARDCARQDGDIWVIYMGNNEVIGPFGAGTVFGPQAPNLALIRGSLALKTTRTGQLLERVLAKTKPRQPSQSEWGGLMMFLRHQLRRDDPRMAAVYASFERNLADILELGKRHQTRVVVSTVVGDLRDCAPFASLHRPGLSAEQQSSWDQHYHAGIEAQAGGRLADAAEAFRQASAIDDQFAELHFRWGRACLALGQTNDARSHLVLARDLDALRFRPDDRLNGIIRKVSTNRERDGIFFADGEAALAAQSPQGLVGREFLYEHVHLTFEGNYLLARTLAEQVARALPPAVASRASPRSSWASLDDCARRLGWSEWQRHQGTAAMLARLNDAPFTSQANHAEQRQFLEQQLGQLAPSRQTAAIREAVAVCREALARAPDDWVLQENLARLAQKLGDQTNALNSWSRVAQLMPHYAEPRRQMGLLYAQLNQGDEAVRAAEEALRLDPTDVMAINGLGRILERQGRHAEAIQHYERALQRNPDQGLTHLGLGLSLLALGNSEQADVHFRRALQYRLNTPSGLSDLGKVCHSRGWFNEAATNFSDALRLDPSDVPAHLMLGQTLAALGRFAEAREHYAEAVRLDPNLAEAHFRLGFELGRQGNDEEALKQFTEAVRLKPDLVEARLNLGIALMNARRLAEALEHLQEALRLSPTNAAILSRIETVRKMLAGGQ